ncbi:hypothetical protein C5167_045515 [Papaver somniferum]|uniref:Bifunctional inhibitor/plant lipid transfer protein/seed storage helical domain-containing protein n=1 Tax=Papaver somniferum TaxID=3469 RepID=A0A4Y7LES8_PAPSO|nr:uncharacterized protein LOC113322478 [Papaver somniferum]RZC82729.1 hypothetical protein C5167_045515 [Papaver somniferum]
MAAVKIYVLALAFLGMLSSDHLVHTADAAANDDQSCDDNFKGLVNECASYVMKWKWIPKRAPSIACCAAVNKTDVDCICSHVTKKVESQISMGKAVYVAEKCDRPLPRGSQCGSYTVPAA